MAKRQIRVTVHFIKPGFYVAKWRANGKQYSVRIHGDDLDFVEVERKRLETWLRGEAPVPPEFKDCRGIKSYLADSGQKQPPVDMDVQMIMLLLDLMTKQERLKVLFFCRDLMEKRGMN